MVYNKHLWVLKIYKIPFKQSLRENMVKGGARCVFILSAISAFQGFTPRKCKAGNFISPTPLPGDSLSDSTSEGADASGRMEKRTYYSSEAALVSPVEISRQKTLWFTCSFFISCRIIHIGTVDSSCHLWWLVNNILAMLAIPDFLTCIPTASSSCLSLNFPILSLSLFKTFREGAVFLNKHW